MWRRVGTTALILLLAACAAQRPLITTPVDWNEAKLQRQSLPQWTLAGRAAVTVAEDGWNAVLNWQQLRDHSSLRLSGPFGVGGVAVEFAGEALTIDSGKGERLTGAAAQRQLEQTLGVSLPFTSLRYWLLAVPEPVTPALAQLGLDGHLARLNQREWELSYSRYAYRDGQWLPGLITARHGSGITLKVVVDRWTLGS